ncbi:regulatory protein GemA [Neisseriaceae bacterium TC5R-5]|nr:regulatory protein GemA [Neisseriaceae bacterium TC5R-5]
MNESKTNPNRQRLIKLIHVAKRDLALDDDSYRAILMRIGKQTSAADLTIPQLDKVLEYLKTSGFKVRSKSSSRPLASDMDSKKIRALWLFLCQLGAVRNPSEAALASYVKRLTKVEALQWLNSEQVVTVIESMKKWAMRFLPAAVKALAEEARAIRLPASEAEALQTVLSKAFKYKTYDPMHNAWECLSDVLAQGNKGE